MIDNPQRIRVLCVDDHRVVQQGITGLLAAGPDMALVAEAANGREGIQQFRAHRPDVTLFRALQAGARGYLLKNALHEEPLDTRPAVHTGRKALASHGGIVLVIVCGSPPGHRHWKVAN